MVTDQFFSPPSLERQTGCFGSDLGEGGILPEVTDAAHPAPKALNFFEKKRLATVSFWAVFGKSGWRTDTPSPMRSFWFSKVYSDCLVGRSCARSLYLSLPPLPTNPPPLVGVGQGGSVRVERS